MNPKNILYTWKYDDSKNRWPLWYIIVASLAITLFIIGFITKVYGMSFLVVILSWVYFFIENNSEDETLVEIQNLGIKVQENLYDYSRIESFCILYENTQAAYLQLHIKKRNVHTLHIRVNNEISEGIRPILSQYIKEDSQREISFLEKILRICKL